MKRQPQAIPTPKANPTKAKSPKKLKGPHCVVCDGVMTVKRVIPAAHIFPELRTYQCEDCGVMRSVESENELSPVAAEIVPAAEVAQKSASNLQMKRDQ